MKTRTKREYLGDGYELERITVGNKTWFAAMRKTESGLVSDGCYLEANTRDEALTIIANWRRYYEGELV